MISHLTLTTHTQLAHIWWHLHVADDDLGFEEPTSMLAAGFIPLSYGEAADVTVEQILEAVVDHLKNPNDLRADDASGAG